MHITKEHNKCKKGSIYFCFIGSLDGHDFIDKAFLNGASKVIGTKNLNIDNYIKVDDIYIEFAKYAKEIYEYDKVNMDYIGITGTDGKTSTAIIINKILNKLSTSSYLGTSGFIKNNDLISYSGLTTPFADELYKNISDANKTSDYFVMEVSSHSLKQKRAYGLNYKVGIFTNFTRDHLDYHKTLKDYFNSKMLLKDYIVRDGYFLVNSEIKLDDKTNVKTFGYDGDYKISDVNLSTKNTTFKLTVDNVTYDVKSMLLAEFNVFNLASAIACVHLLGYEINDIIKVVGDIVVDGRMQLINSTTTANVVLDFAHTPDSIKKATSFLRELYKDKKICVVTGSAGGRDKEKRPHMGKSASDFSELLILTLDDPRFEDVKEICEELKSGVVNKECEVKIIEDRIDAIKYALDNTSKDDVVLLLGKSGQTKMYVNDSSYDYEEEKEVLKIIKEYDERY